MNGVVFLAIICIWAADDTTPTKYAFAREPSMAVCQANALAAKRELEKDPNVRFVSVSCVELDRGNKA